MAALAAAYAASGIASASFKADRARAMIEAVGDPGGRPELADAAYDAAAESSLGEASELAAMAALLKSPADTDAARTRTQAALRRSPARPASWARLAYVDAVEDGVLDPEGLAALKLSYLTGPLGALDFIEWRLRFCAEIWPALDEETRQATLRQVWAAPWAARRVAERRVRNPEGRAAVLAASDRAIEMEQMRAPG